MDTIAGAERDERTRIDRIAAGDRPSFEAFYAAYIGRIHAFAYALVTDAELAEEIAADVMVEIWKSAHRYRGLANVSTWVFAIVHHRAIAATRRKRLTIVPIETAAARGITDDPLDGALLGDDNAALDAALQTLSPNHRAILELTYTYDCTQAEIAMIVDVPVATVKTRLFHAKRNVRAALERNAQQKDVS